MVCSVLCVSMSSSDYSLMSKVILWRDDAGGKNDVIIPQAMSLLTLLIKYIFGIRTAH